MTSIFAGLPLALAALVGVSYYAFADVPPTPFPPQNQLSEPKRVLGKILFFDEQLSTSNTVACATCHVMSRGGNDQRTGVNPGLPQVPNDNRIGSVGVIRMDQNLNFFRDPVFGLGEQITSRAANSPINSAFNIDSFWDGRARSQFVDPQTNTVAIPQGGSLESQAVGPITNSVEMAHDGVDWSYMVAKLPNAQPLQLATNVPPDIAAVLASKPTYPQLFAAAFGDGAITARRIAFAIATYERTLVSNQAPFDMGTMSFSEQQGLETFQQANCVACHTLQNGLFTGHGFRNIGLRPPGEDLGRELVTNNPADRGRFKVPSLRNVGLKRNFMHNGQFTSLIEVVRFYARVEGAAPQFPDNRDPVMNTIVIPTLQEQPLVEFLQNGLTDPRVAAQQFPFDRPTLYGERPEHRSAPQGGGVAGTGGLIPSIIANQPAFVGNMDLRIGVFNAVSGGTASLYASLTPPANGRINRDRLLGMTATGTGVGSAGIATVNWQLTPGTVTAGEVYFLQWVIQDPLAPNGEALSRVVSQPIFCGLRGCPNPCGTADFNGDGDFGTDQDIEAFFACLAGNCCATCYSMGGDFNGDGDTGTDQDIEAFFRVLAGGSC